MNANAVATFCDGTKISGRLTTEHAASSYGQPVFVDDKGRAFDWWQISEIKTASELGNIDFVLSTILGISVIREDE